jgi:hypothetical protein
MLVVAEVLVKMLQELQEELLAQEAEMVAVELQAQAQMAQLIWVVEQEAVNLLEEQEEQELLFCQFQQLTTQAQLLDLLQ